jgi:hypothetical protein
MYIEEEMEEVKSNDIGRKVISVDVHKLNVLNEQMSNFYKEKVQKL